MAIIFGDFNKVRNAKERKGVNTYAGSCARFNYFILNNNLIDVKIGGTEFTWIKGGRAKMSKLDRFLISENFGEFWPNYEVTPDVRLFSDHKPLILKHIKRSYGFPPFKFYNTWLEEGDLGDIVKKVWCKFELEGKHLKLFKIMQQLKSLKNAIKLS